ncbi:MAG TPA: metallophosphoesterase family protein [Gemmatimonadaceae bacterium]|nr:metallophosphoesterase family protein [Gemmatimonadaceae bacterium]
MRVAAIYDIHGNLPALEAVLAEIRREKVDQIVVGGDVMPGPMTRETLAYLRAIDMPILFIRGNGDRAALEERAGKDSGVRPRFRVLIQHCARALSETDAREVGSWPEKLRMEIAGLGQVLFCHATPRNDTEIFTRRTPVDRLLPVFAGVEERVVVCGHTHMQFDRMVGKTRVVNAGSVGMPFGDPGAYWALLGPDIELRRTEYDLERAAELIRATDYPDAEDLAENNILHPPTEESILERYAHAELKG